MEEKLISKKELLSRYGISYGALYRWKRMGLIPEEWFIRKATETGQETFFREEVICERINQIIAAKDVTSLQKLAQSMEENKKPEDTLIIETVYGNRQFKVSDIRRITLNETIDITDSFADILRSIDTKDEMRTDSSGTKGE